MRVWRSAHGSYLRWKRPTTACEYFASLAAREFVHDVLQVPAPFCQQNHLSLCGCRDYPQRTPNNRDCGEWVWSPGGARLNPRWVGPTVTLTAAAGSCTLLGPGVHGQGSPGWTAARIASIACQGPSLQRGFVSFQSPFRPRGAKEPAAAAQQGFL